MWCHTFTRILTQKMIQRNQGTNLITSQNTLVIIPANGSSNNDSVPIALLTLNKKPLICHAIDTARQLAENIEVCVSSNDINIIKTVNSYGLHVPFKLPQELYTETFDVDEVILHAIDHYARKELNFGDTEMVAGVKILSRPVGKYYLTENQEKYLQKHSDISNFNGKTIYKYNNAFAILKTAAIRQYPRAFFSRICKYVMDNTASIFVENINDITRCEAIISS